VDQVEGVDLASLFNRLPKTRAGTGDDDDDEQAFDARDDPCAGQLVGTADDRATDHPAAFHPADNHPERSGHSAGGGHALRPGSDGRVSRLELGRSGELCGNARRIRLGTPRRVTGGARALPPSADLDYLL